MSGSFRAVIDGDIVALVGPTGKELASLKLIPAEAEHRNFILSTWVKSYEKQNRNNHWSGLSAMRPETFRSGEGSLAERHWEKSVVVASIEDNYTIHGWICFIGSTLLHVYVPPTMRPSGLSEALVHYYLGTSYASTKPMPGWVSSTDKVSFNPYVMLQ